VFAVENADISRDRGRVRDGPAQVATRSERRTRADEGVSQGAWSAAVTWSVDRKSRALRVVYLEGLAAPWHGHGSIDGKRCDTIGIRHGPLLRVLSRWKLGSRGSSELELPVGHYPQRAPRE
jgi:hypothetical protein